MAIKRVLAKGGAKAVGVAMDYAISYAKARGTEDGKNGVGKKKTGENEKNGFDKKMWTKDLMDWISREMDTDTIDENLAYLGGLIDDIIPIATRTCMAYFLLPIIVGGGTYAFIGVGLSDNIYAMTNLYVLLDGLKLTGEKLKERSHKNSAEMNAADTEETGANTAEDEPQERHRLS
jgi:hypothetical protein